MKRFFILFAILILSNNAIASSVWQICDTHYMASDKENCLMRLSDKHIDYELIGICLSYYYAKEKEECAFRLSNKIFPEGSGIICSRYYQAVEKETCLYKLGRPLPSMENNSVVIQKQKMIKWLNDLDLMVSQNNSYQAKKLIAELRSLVLLK